MGNALHQLLLVGSLPVVHALNPHLLRLNLLCLPRCKCPLELLLVFPKLLVKLLLVCELPLATLILDIS